VQTRGIRRLSEVDSEGLPCCRNAGATLLFD
jgi:hypothetical protein